MAETMSGAPLRRHWFHVLVALADRDRHGSDIARDVLEQTDGARRLWPATLYRTLDEMLAAGLIRELAGDEHPEGVSERRRYYRITARGTRALEAESERLAAWAGLARQRLNGP